MSKKKPKKRGQTIGQKHGRKAMVKEDDGWIRCRFEFDSDGQGIKWQQGMSSGETVEKLAGHFESIGYTIVEWKNV